MVNNNYSFIELGGQLIPNASSEEKHALTKIFSPQATSSLGNEPLAEAICRNGGNGIANLFRGHGVAYLELLFDTAKLMKIEPASSITSMTKHGVSLAEMDARYFKPGLDAMNQIFWRDELGKFTLTSEKAILSKVATEIYSNMTSDQKKIVDRKIQEIAQTIPGQRLSGIGTASALVILGNLGGFATYTLMSSIISSITLGSVGFGVYTFASSALSVLLGPIGVIGVGAAAIYNFAEPDERRSLQAVATIAMIRQRLIGEKVLSY